MIPGAVPWPKEREEKYTRECWPNKTFAGKPYVTHMEKPSDFEWDSAKDQLN